MSTIRIYKPVDLKADRPIRLNANELHYLTKVMRCSADSVFYMYNQAQGEWECKLDGKDALVIKQVRPTQSTTNPKSIAIACIKPKRLEWCIAKLTELNVADVFLLETDRSQRIQVNYTRLQTIATESSEQCNRLDIPTIHPIQTLENFLSTLQGGWSFGHTKATNNENKRYDGIVVGPEGGWSDQEILKLTEKCSAIRLHQNILRSETAGIIGLHTITNL